MRYFGAKKKKKNFKNRIFWINLKTKKKITYFEFENVNSFSYGDDVTFKNK